MRKTSDAKSKLLRVAFDLIWCNSYGSVSVDQICERARVNKGSFYHFFPSKADLAVAAYEAFWQEKRPDYDRIFSPQVPPLRRIEGWCQAIYKGQKEKFEKCGRVLGCPYASVGAEMSTQEEKVRRKAEEVFDRSCQYLESALADALRGKMIDIKDPKKAARTVYAVGMGLLLQAKVKNDIDVLLDLEPSVKRLLGARQARAPRGSIFSGVITRMSVDQSVKQAKIKKTFKT